MGLFIGASILTLLEILDYIYEASKGPVRGPSHSWWRIGEAVGKQRGSVGFLVEGWLGSQALGS